MRKALHLPRTVILLVVVAVGAGASANEFILDWFTIDGGGGMWITGGTLELSGTIGQPDATSSVLTGGDFALVGGFWKGETGGAQHPGDFDGDGDVDLDDYAQFAACVAGPGGAPPPECEAVDLDGDGDIDLQDFCRWQPLFTGAGQ